MDIVNSTAGSITTPTQGHETAEQQQTWTAQDIPIGGIERLTLVTTLRDISSRLGALEGLATSKPAGNTERSLIEILKIVFGGWPIFGFTFLILFYSPLREALLSIPEKVRSAQEIQVAGVSLKSAIRNEAVRLGVGELSETIPRLSGSTLEFFLRAPSVGYQGANGFSSIFSWKEGPGGMHAAWFPSQQLMKILTELLGLNPGLYSGPDPGPTRSTLCCPPEVPGRPERVRY